MIFKTLITARGDSKSIPKKNIIKINNKPLIAYSILASLESLVDETWVSTEDSEIKGVSIKWGAKVIDRPKELATDTILNEPSLLQFADQVKFDCIVFIQPTSPFIKSKYINIGIEMMKSRKFDSVFTATLKHWAPIWSKDIKPIEWEIDNRPRRQDREEYYEARREPAEDSPEHAVWQEKMAKIYSQADIIIAKQRHGPVGTVKVFYDGRFTKFGNLDL